MGRSENPTNAGRPVGAILSAIEDRGYRAGTRDARTLTDDFRGVRGSDAPSARRAGIISARNVSISACNAAGVCRRLG